MKIALELLTQKKATLSAMERDRQPHWQLWRELADFYLPRRYSWLLSESERRVRNAKNPYILDNTGTAAARTLASGMMNGVTSPSRPWFKLRIAGFSDEVMNEVRIWLDEVARRMLLVMAESNFYNAMAVMYLDLVVFGSAAMLIYEDFESVIRCYNPCLGEFYFAQSDRLQVNTFAREFTYKVHQVVEWWDEKNVSDRVRERYKLGGAALQDDVQICHLIEPNIDGRGSLPKKFKFREYYWEKGVSDGQILAERGFNEMPGVFPRWELSGNDAYGTCPAMDALGDVIQLQHETKKKAQGLDMAFNPPMVADIQLQNRPTALLPKGITYVAGINNMGLKPAFQVNPPLGEMTLDIREVQSRIRETFHNDLFRMISQLETVRSATEIDARREEKLVLLGSVLDRFENEALDPGLNRVFGIAQRAGLFPPPPQSIAGSDIQIQYVSILSSAQRAVGVVPVERWLGLIGEVSAVHPEALDLPNWDELLRNYGTDLGVSARDINSREEVMRRAQQRQQQLAAQEAAATGAVLVEGAKTLSETDVGGGANALQRMLGG